MSYLSRYYVMAENELNLRRSKNAEIQKEHIEKAEKIIPQIKEMKKKLAAGGARLSTILLRNGNAGQSVKEICAENMEIKRQMKQLLVDNGFDENYLDPVHSCEKCKDTGIYEGKRCSCFMNDVQRFQCSELNKASGMSLCSFDSFDISFYPEVDASGKKDNARKTMEMIFSYCRKYAQDFHLPNNGILMLGATGLGKTHLSLAVGNEVIKRGYSVIYGSAPNLFRQIEKEHFSTAEQIDTESLLWDCDLLILDDLGAEFDSKFNQAALYNMINTRMNKGNPSIVSTNLTLSEIQERYGERISSRIFTMEKLPFRGKDIRPLKHIQK